MDDRKRFRAFARSLGAGVPVCAGHHAPGDPECDGVPPCAWRSGCRAFIDLCGDLGTTPDRFRAHLPDKSVLYAVWHRLRSYVPSGPNKDDLRVMRGWGRFLGAFREACPVIVHSSGATAAPGELVIGTLHEARLKRPRAYSVQVARLGGPPRVLCYYWTEAETRLEPTIEFRADLRSVLDLYPQIEVAARRWRPYGPRGKRDRQRAAVAVRVFPERIEDFGRLLAALIAEGEIKGFGLREGKIEEVIE